MSLRVLLVVLAVFGAGVYVWKATEPRHYDPPQSVEAQTTGAEAKLEQARKLLAATKKEEQRIREEGERISRAKDDREFDQMQDEMNRQVQENEQREERKQAQKQARVERQNEEWQKELDDAVARRQAWEDYNSSKDAVGEVRCETEGKCDHGSGYLIETPNQTLRRSYGDAATLEQNELQ